MLCNFSPTAYPYVTGFGQNRGQCVRLPLSPQRLQASLTAEAITVGETAEATAKASNSFMIT